MNEKETSLLDLQRSDRALFGSLLKHVVRAAPNEAPFDFVLAAIGRNVGADRCYVYRFWEPGKSSMCTNTHEWCSDGIKPEIGEQQTCDLADLAEINACITSGRDFMFADIDAIDAGLRKYLEPQGIQSLIATPLEGEGGTVCGFVGFDFVKARCGEITDRIMENIHEAADILACCQRIHEGDLVLLDIAQGTNEYEENGREFERELIELQKDAHTARPKEMLEIVRNRLDADVCYIVQNIRPEGGGTILPEHALARDGWTNALSWTIDSRLGRALDMRLMNSSVVTFREGEIAWLKANIRREESHADLADQLKVVHSVGIRHEGVLRGVLCVGYFEEGQLSTPLADFLRRSTLVIVTALEFMSIAYDNERHEKTINKIQEHQRFRADALAYALSKDDLPGLIDLIMHRLLELTVCDYIAIHSVDGVHRLLYPEGDLMVCPERCEACSFYRLEIPPTANADNIIELNDTKGQSVASLSPDCPAKSLEVVVVYCEGKPWGGIALHYLMMQREISEDDRRTLKIAADVLTLALERHSAALRLKEERDRVVEAEKARSYFFSSVSHDIRTPLNAIIGFSELLQTGDVPPEEAKQNLKMIVTSGKTLLQLVNDVLDLSKMDLGKLEFSCEPTDVGELVRELLPVFMPMTKTRGQTIVTDMPDLPRLMPDPYRFRQILFNLVGNAVKYAGPCTIRVSLAYEDGLLKLTVADDGKGVTAEKAKRLMQPFVQADIKNRSEGSGLGLAICKRILEIAHGTISIDTAPGKGFTVRAEVPTDVAPDDKAAASAVSASAVDVVEAPWRILVADDSPVNRAVLVAMLKKMGITDVALAEDGRAALDELERDSSFDLVLSDIWMPVMDGVELVKRIRADARLAHLKVCSITADVEARTTYAEQGFDALLLKPVTIEKLTDLLNTFK